MRFNDTTPVDRSKVDVGLSGLKCEISRFSICFRLILSLVDVKIIKKKTAKNDR